MRRSGWVMALVLWASSVGAATPFGPQKTLVVTVNQPGLTEFARQTVFDWLDPWLDWVSDHRASIVGIQHPADGDAINVTIPGFDTAGCDATFAKAGQIEAAATAAGYNAALYDREFLLIQDASCGTFIGQTVSAKVMFFISWFDRGLAAHEFGHALGADHTDTLFCGAVAFQVNALSTCYAYGQQDIFDPMGHGQLEYSAWWKYKIWGDPLTTITADGDYPVFPLDDGVLSAAEGLRIQLSAQTSFVLEWRPAADPGVRVLWQSDLTGHLYDLDMTPGENYYGNAGLPLGQSWTDPVSGVTLAYLSTVSGHAVVRVSHVSGIPQPLTITPSDYYHVDRMTSVNAPLVVTFPLPAVSGGYPPYTETCSPPSGSLFPIGGTTGWCQAIDSHQQGVQNLLIVGVTYVPAGPVPVDCVVGAWLTVGTTISATDALTVGLTQTRTKTTVEAQQRPILTAPANGGTACPLQ